MDHPRPVLVYDGACAFCRRWVARWQARTGDRVDYLPLQRGRELRRLGVSPSAARRRVQLVTPAGARYEGAEAVVRALEHAPELRIAARLGRLPVIRWIAARVYQSIAAHRRLTDVVDRALFGTSTLPPDQRRVSAWFLRGLGLTYFTAFASLGSQLKGLYGERGISPIRTYLDAVRAALPPRTRLHQVPTLFWLDASDAALVRACRAGLLCSLLLAMGVAPRWTAAATWALYLSFVSTGRDFLSFQWDALLLESGLHAIVVAPPGRRSRRAAERVPLPATLLMRWLAFRLQFESGHRKLASGDPTWRSCTACCYHYETQPLPTPLGWYTHQLPRWFQRASTFVALALELVAPFLAWAPRRPRRAGFWLIAALQAAIAATGNYGFFNLLTVVDTLWLLDDEALPRARGRRPPPRRAPGWRRIAVALAAAPIVALSGSSLLDRAWRRFRVPRPIERLRKAMAPLGSVNPYGLFSVMTTTRPEIVIEGSDDAQVWREYSFRYKPGDLRRRPGQVAPHQPRLDWQMWFAALEPPPPWFVRLLVRLLEGSPDVLALLGDNPFPQRPPTFVRALLYDYRMTDRQARHRDGTYWRRELLGVYVPPCTLARAESS